MAASKRSLAACGSITVNYALKGGKGLMQITFPFVPLLAAALSSISCFVATAGEGYRDFQVV
jgi:hypothetical protein